MPNSNAFKNSNMEAWKNGFCFRTRNQNGRRSTCLKWKGSRVTLMQLWSVKIEGAHVNHQWEISRSWWSWGFGFETSGHTWTINWGTISMWPWSRERGLERSGGSRDCNGFLATRTRRRLAARCRCTAAQLGEWRQPDRCIFIWVQYIWYLILLLMMLIYVVMMILILVTRAISWLRSWVINSPDKLFPYWPRRSSSSRPLPALSSRGDHKSSLSSCMIATLILISSGISSVVCKKSTAYLIFVTVATGGTRVNFFRLV